MNVLLLTTALLALLVAILAIALLKQIRAVHTLTNRCATQELAFGHLQREAYEMRSVLRNLFEVAEKSKAHLFLPEKEVGRSSEYPYESVSEENPFTPPPST